MRNSIRVKNAREHNLQGIDVEIPRERLVVVTGLSGSGKSTLAFDTIYAEGQRRFLESLPAFSRKFVSQLKKPAVDFIFGLSPVISIEQKSISKNPRSTVGTMTDIYDYLRILYASTGTAHCPRCEREVPVKTPEQIAERLLSLPAGTEIELDAPLFKVYGEDYAYLLAEVRNKDCRRMRIDDELVDISEDVDLDEETAYVMEAVVDRFHVRRELLKSFVCPVCRFHQRRIEFPNGIHEQLSRRGSAGCGVGRRSADHRAGNIPDCVRVDPALL